ncbi:MAG: hypothetical protein IPQ13_06275 [Holophagaceae bacterium]|nr:hypothetical protein [Holophagaceae bacterium]
MPTIRVRKVPELVVLGVKPLAHAHRRSMEAEILERAVSGDRQPQPAT